MLISILVLPLSVLPRGLTLYYAWMQQCDNVTKQYLFLILVDSFFTFFLMWLTVVLLDKLTFTGIRLHFSRNDGYRWSRKKIRPHLEQRQSRIILLF